MVYNGIMSLDVIKNILSEEDIRVVQETISNEFNNRETIKLNAPLKSGMSDGSVCYYSQIGRIDIKYPKIPKDILNKIYNIVVEKSDKKIHGIVEDFVMYSKYTKSSGGNPKLEPHFDVVDTGTLILDYQLKSNKVWELKIESDYVVLEDNSAVLFDPFENIHSRTIRDFSDDEFVEMLFFRFKTSDEIQERTEKDMDRLKFELDWYSCEREHAKKFKEEF